MTPKEKLKEIYDEYLKTKIKKSYFARFEEYLYLSKYDTEKPLTQLTLECGFSTISECRKAINELKNFEVPKRK